MPAASPQYCIIYNPSAGRGKSARKWQAIQDQLGDEAVYRPTSSRGHAMDLAQQAAAEGFPTVVAAGGDGTVHEVINGLLQAGQPTVPFGVLPLGSGNDYARLIGVPFDIHGMLARLRSSETWAVDAGHITLDGTISRYFCNTFGMGVGGAVTWEASRIRWLRGIPLYGLASLKAIYRHYRNYQVTMLCDDVPMEAKLIYACAAIGKEEGGGFRVAPDARIDDGLFNLMYVTELSRLGALVVLPRLVIPGLRSGCRAIQEKLVRNVTLHSNQPLPVHADGEVLATPQQGAKECVVKMLPGRLVLKGRG
jgi:diacylglycerol kinase (ATP)